MTLTLGLSQHLHELSNVMLVFYSDVYTHNKIRFTITKQKFDDSETVLCSEIDISLYIACYISCYSYAKLRSNNLENHQLEPTWNYLDTKYSTKFIPKLDFFYN